MSTPALVQVSDGPVADVPPVHGAWEADSCYSLIGCLQGGLQRRPDCRHRQDTTAAGNYTSILQGGAGVENLQPHVLDLGQTLSTKLNERILFAGEKYNS